MGGGQQQSTHQLSACLGDPPSCLSFPHCTLYAQASSGTCGASPPAAGLFWGARRLCSEGGGERHDSHPLCGRAGKSPPGSAPAPSACLIRLRLFAQQSAAPTDSSSPACTGASVCVCGGGSSPHPPPRHCGSHGGCWGHPRGQPAGCWCPFACAHGGIAAAGCGCVVLCRRACKSPCCCVHKVVHRNAVGGRRGGARDELIPPPPAPSSQPRRPW